MVARSTWAASAAFSARSAAAACVFASISRSAISWRAVSSDVSARVFASAGARSPVAARRVIRLIATDAPIQVIPPSRFSRAPPPAQMHQIVGFLVVLDQEGRRSGDGLGCDSPLREVDYPAPPVPPAPPAPPAALP